MFVKGILIALITLALDQLSKWYFIALLHENGEPITVLPFFNLVMVWNKGISFGLFQDIVNGPTVLSFIALIIVIILLIWLKKNTSLLVGIAIGFIIGGAIGNVIDRARFGAVADFFDVHIAGYHWPAFNIADSAVFIGAVILCFDSIFRNHDEEKE